jgi:hypothetical protein
MSASSNQPLVLNQLAESMDFQENENPIELMELFLKKTASVVNTKEGALYIPLEIGNFQKWFTPNEPFVLRNDYRQLFDMVGLNGGTAIPAGTTSFPHGIVGITTFTRIFGTATNSDTPVKFLPLPYTSNISNKSIEIWFDPTNVNITVGSAQSPLTQCYVIGEYLKT